MTDQNHHNHASCCMGHVRAQRCAMDSHCAALFEKEKASIKSYEDGWDEWDGPIWPWRETNNPEGQQKMENEYQGCCNTPPEKVAMLTQAISQKAQPHIESPHPARPTSSCGSASPTSSLWSSRTASPCPTCGRGASSSHL
ncbi:hypothetical protein K432DRAFT_392950 [Lepidopterella palustris CBS 459.81]|uniref:Uncharacterized protein n=1 Tax=Lepidopterella palustris CBS 459.81 TaxID=1314670 RepID=A0A8E2EAQ9_9PEZI|nr:hypothetical protein K432DRAFT_392950 [Lepidopterella palustris CBS 459.81]